jgi:hypothetical protein
MARAGGAWRSTAHCRSRAPRRSTPAIPTGEARSQRALWAVADLLRAHEADRQRRDQDCETREEGSEHAALEWCVEKQRWLVHNPGQRRRAATPRPHGDARLVVRPAGGVPAGDRGRLAVAIYRLAVFTGMRRGEPLGLRWDDVDLEAATGRVVRRRLQVAGEMVETAGTKTRRGMRTVDVDEGTVAALRRWRRRRLEERLAAGEPWVESDLPGNRRAGCGRRGSRRCAASTCRRSGGTTSATHTRR